jgi:hypothetical protein
VICFLMRTQRRKYLLSLLPAVKVWEGVPAKKKFPYFDPEVEEPENWTLAT